MIIDIICLQHIKFKNESGENVEGYQAWYLDPFVQNENMQGTLPRKRWFSPDQAREFQMNQVGKYDVEVNLNGRIISCKKAK